MTDKMVERVARAIEPGIWSDSDLSRHPPKERADWFARRTEPTLERARAAIEAMREPTQAMINAAPDLGAVDFYPSEVWRAMIAAALAEETT